MVFENGSWQRLADTSVDDGADDADDDDDDDVPVVPDEEEVLGRWVDDF